MTHREFNELYNNGEISVKIYSGTMSDGVNRTIEAFEYCGKYYLRIHNVFYYVTGTRRFDKRYKMSRESHIIKEFNDRDYALNYFKKCSVGLNRVA